MNKSTQEKFDYNKTPIGAGNGIVDGIGTLGPNYGIPQNTESNYGRQSNSIYRRS